MTDDKKSQLDMATTSASELRDRIHSTLNSDTAPEIKEELGALSHLLAGFRHPGALESLSIYSIGDLYGELQGILRGLAALPSQVQDERRRLLTEISERYSRVAKLTGLQVFQAHPAFSKLFRSAAELTRTTEKVNEIAARLLTLEEETKTKLVALQHELERIAAKKYSASFTTAENQFRRVSWRWLAAIVLCTSGLLFLGWQSFRHPTWGLSQSPSTAEVATHIAGRVIMLSVLFYVLGIATRSYRAAKHNEVTSQHRAIALNTFLVFRDAATDDGTKNAVLLRTTEAIFQHRSTGHETTESETSPGSTTILEVLRRTGESKG